MCAITAESILPHYTLNIIEYRDCKMKEKLFIEKLTSAISYVNFEGNFWEDNLKYKTFMESHYYCGDYDDRISNSGLGYYPVNRIRDIILHYHTKS